MKTIEFTTLSGQKKTVAIRDDQLKSVRALLVKRPELTLSDVMNAALDCLRLEQASKRFPFDLYEVNGGVRAHRRFLH